MAEKLRRHRTLLLACEAIGWLHMTEKAHKDFLLRFGHAGIRNGENEAVKQQVYAILERLKWVAELNKKQKAEDPQKVSLLNWPESFADFIHYPHKAESKQDVVGCLQAGHAMASGIEKNVPNKPSEYLQQNARQMWLVTAFGHPLRNLLIEPHEFLTDDGWKNLIKQIRKSITNLKKLGEHRPRYVKGWWQWREAAIGSLGCLRRAFDTTLAETRVPNNDVSLWDQSYVASALFKSAVAGLILLEDLSDEAWENLKQKTRWRVLTVGIGTDHYEARAVRIGDWLGSRRAIESFFKDVCRLIEVDLAVGSLLYRDDQILAFSFPGQRSD